MKGTSLNTKQYNEILPSPPPIETHETRIRVLEEQVKCLTEQVVRLNELMTHVVGVAP